MFVFLLITLKQVNAQSCATGSLSFTTGGTSYAMPAFSFADYTGTLAVSESSENNTDETYYFTIDRSGDFTTQNLLFYYFVPGQGWGNWSPGSNHTIDCLSSSGFAISGTIPSTATCGQKETIKLHFWVGGITCNNDVCDYVYYIGVPSQTINGPANLCTATNYSISSPVTLSGNFTWSLSNNAWKFQINNQSTYTGTATALVVVPPSGVVSTNIINISGGNLCQPISKSITTNIAQPQWSYTYPSACINGNTGYPVTWTISTVNCATSYSWSFTGTPGGIILQPSSNGLSCIIAPKIVGNYGINVVAKNSYSTSATQSGNIFVRPYDPIHCNGVGKIENITNENIYDAILDDNNTDINRKTTKIEDEGIAGNNIISIYPNPATQSVDVSIEAGTDDNYSINIFTIMGKPIYSSNNYYSAGSHKVNIDVKDLSNGIYIIIAGNSYNKMSQKMIILH